MHESTECFGGREAVSYKNRNMHLLPAVNMLIQFSRKASLIPLLCVLDRGGPVAPTQKDANEGMSLACPYLYTHDAADVCQGRCCGPGWTSCATSCTTPVSYPPALICSAPLDSDE